MHPQRPDRPSPRCPATYTSAAIPTSTPRCSGRRGRRRRRDGRPSRGCLNRQHPAQRSRGWLGTVRAALHPSVHLRARAGPSKTASAGDLFINDSAAPAAECKTAASRNATAVRGDRRADVSVLLHVPDGSGQSARNAHGAREPLDRLESVKNVVCRDYERHVVDCLARQGRSRCDGPQFLLVI